MKSKERFTFSKEPSPYAQAHIEAQKKAAAKAKLTPAERAKLKVHELDPREISSIDLEDLLIRSKKNP